ncbi:Leucine-rich repeat domain, L domain-like [Phytophthora cactorum]|nr:Leucine-rich repeat domain, L domain-like [Phytophthora cactorum]
MFRFALAAAGLSAYFAAVQASVSVTISNSCSESVALYDNSATTTLASGSYTTRTLANGYVGMFRNGVSDEATLAEISVDSDGTPWYDISIIPPDPGSCTSLSACQAQTGKTGFNTAMQITPLDNIGEGTCEVLTCEADGCSDAYQYPSDDTKTHTCPEGTSFEVTFCPDGTGTSTSSTTTSSASSTPTPTTATPTPTTATTATSTATPTPTPTPTEAPVSSSASGSDSTGIQVQSQSYTSNFTLSSASNSASAGSAGNAGVETAGETTKSTKTSTDSPLCNPLARRRLTLATRTGLWRKRRHWTWKPRALWTLETAPAAMCLCWCPPRTSSAPICDQAPSVMSTDEHLSMMDEAELDVQQKEVEEVVDMESSEPGLLRREQVTKRLSILGRNPFTQAHIYTTATLTGLHLSDIDAISEFPHIQHLVCRQNELQSLSPLQHIPLLLTLDSAENQLTEVLDFKVPKCCLDNAWVDGARWIGSLLRRPRLTRIRSSPCLVMSSQDCVRLQRLELAHNNVGDINELNCLASLRYLGQMSLHGNPLVEAQVSRVFYRGRVLRRLLQLEKLDDEQVTSKEKVKALVMHVAISKRDGRWQPIFISDLKAEDIRAQQLPVRNAPLVRHQSNDHARFSLLIGKTLMLLRPVLQPFTCRMPAPRRALRPSSPAPDSDTNCTSPQYQAVSTPTRTSAQEFDLLVDEVVRSRSHSHALSAILGANSQVSASASTSLDWRPSSQAQLQIGNSATQLQREQVAEGEEKTELPVRLVNWRRQRRYWKKVLFWVGAVGFFIGFFALSFAAPKQVQTLAPIVLGAGLSLVSTLLVLVSFLRRRRLRRRPNELLAFVALSEFGLAALTMIHVLTLCSAEDGGCRPMGLTTCSISASLEMFMLLAGVGWFGAAILHLFVSVSNPFASYKRQLVLYHLVVWGLSLIASIATPLILFSGHTQDKFPLSDAEACRMVALILPLLPSDAGESVANRRRRLAQWQELNLEFWGLLVAIVVLVVVAAQLSLVVGWWRSNSGTIIALKARRRLMKRMAIYVHALNAMWLVLLVVFFVYRSNTSALDYVQVEGVAQPTDGGMNFLNAFFHFVLTGKGFVTGVVWLSVNKPCCAFGLVFCGLHQCKDSDDSPSLGQSASGSSQSASFSGSSNREIRGQRANQAAILSETVMSMEAGVLAPHETPMLSPSSTVSNFEAHESVRESSALRPPEQHSLPTLSSVLEPASMARSSRSSSSSYEPPQWSPASTLEYSSIWRQPHLQHSQNQENPSPQSARLSLTASSVMFHTFQQTPGRFSLYPVSQVPFELFEQEIELQSTRSSVDEPVEGRSTRSAVFAGLRRTATSAFSQGRGVFRSRSGSTEPTDSSNSTMTREFLPDDPKPKCLWTMLHESFEPFRLAFGLSDEKYLASFRTTAKERVSAGSSGAFMFFSGDNSLLVKSLKEKECRALVDMAPAYARYLTANPHSRLIRFFGCHRVRLYGRNFYFAVMSNVLHSERHTATITEKYDVKGSWVDRRARRPQRGDRVTCAECDATYTFDEGDTPVDSDNDRVSTDDHTVPQFPFHVHRPDVVFKDLDLERSLQLPRHIAVHLHSQIVSDCEFLRDIGIMDYSLLIGIHKCHFRAPRPGNANGIGTSTDFDDVFNRELHLDGPNSGVNLAPLGDNEVYFVGIIDILQQWDWEKQFEKAGKVLLGKSARGISAVAPTAYCRRFQARCAQILLGGPAPENLDPDCEVDSKAVNVKETKSRPDSKNIKEMAMTNLISDKASSWLYSLPSVASSSFFFLRATATTATAAITAQPPRPVATYVPAPVLLSELACVFTVSVLSLLDFEDVDVDGAETVVAVVVVPVLVTFEGVTVAASCSSSSDVEFEDVYATSGVLSARKLHVRCLRLNCPCPDVFVVLTTSGLATAVAEFSITGGYIWYDISIIPAGSTGPGKCGSLGECKAVTGGTGFNTAMQISPSECTTVTCMADGCTDAYHYPSDGSKTHSCSDTATIDLIFCPGTPISAARTSAPTTAAPSPVPTTSALKTTAPTSAPPQPNSISITARPQFTAPEPTETAELAATETTESVVIFSSSFSTADCVNSSSSRSLHEISVEDTAMSVNRRWSPRRPRRHAAAQEPGMTRRFQRRRWSLVKVLYTRFIFKFAAGPSLGSQLVQLQLYHDARKFMMLGLAALATAVEATTLTIQNQCSESIGLYDNSASETVASGVAEFSITGGYTWYDISIIPTGSSGPGNCASLGECKEVTGGTGFNTPMQVAPTGCTTVTCLEDGCADAYHPKQPYGCANSASSSSWDGSGSSSSSSSSGGSLSGNTITFPPADNMTQQAAAATTTRAPTSADSNGQTTTTETASSSGTRVGTIVAATVGAVAVVGAIAAIIVVRRKKQQVDASALKDDLEWLDEFSGMATPVTRIPTIISDFHGEARISLNAGNGAGRRHEDQAVNLCNGTMELHSAATATLSLSHRAPATAWSLRTAATRHTDTAPRIRPHVRFAAAFLPFSFPIIVGHHFFFFFLHLQRPNLPMSTPARGMIFPSFLQATPGYAKFAKATSKELIDKTCMFASTFQPGSCSSLEDCKAVTQGTGFNVAMMIVPSSGGGTNSTRLAEYCVVSTMAATTPTNFQIRTPERTVAARKSSSSGFLC